MVKLKKTKQMHYKDSPLYQSFLPRERKHLDKFMEEAPENRTKETLQQQVKMMKFKNGEQMTDLFGHLDLQGNVSPRSSSSRSVGGTSKDTFKKNAYRRWKRKGFITITNDKEFVLLKGVKYEIVKEGKAIKLVSPGQEPLIPKGEGKEKVDVKGKKKVKTK